MFKRKILFILSAILLFEESFFAQEIKETAESSEIQDEIEKSPPLSIFAKLDGIYYFKSKKETGGDHFAALDSIYDGIVARTSLNAQYRLDMPLGEHFLLKDANLLFGGAVELSPVSLRPMANVYYTPLPFLELGAGASIGTGWSLAGKWNGMAKYDFSEKKYKSLNPFRDWYTEFWAQATFQMDTGAIWQGDWTHILFLATEKIFYERMTGAYNSIWEWQATKHYANGWQHFEKILLGYQMPMKLQIAGIMAEFSSHFDKNDYGKIAESFGGDFTTVSISPFVRVQFTKKDRLDALFRISRRRSFESRDSSSAEIEPTLTKSGCEWFLDQIAFSFMHTF